MLTPQPFSIKVSKLLEEIQAAKAAGRTSTTFELSSRPMF
jgi:hypothetical protein